ncbi:MULTISPECIES: sulfurtransferase [unclassified Streptomyces]|uniref:sulfurtransferase n=1 Tax=unclassified Streptomyces TaxID=2593676 RepID=UPI000DAB5C42|nr:MULTISPECIES: sulfurtransferase [unclassified Streptomyces]PZT77144.1 sulfurtransferase [Streptomyces sp. AC1-42W]PZT78905.1 sulfurtransferase [Streptomyces sp. AC1-42T]
MKPIISASDCVSALAGPRPPVLLDVRWQLGGPHGLPDYEAGHIPGAVFVDLDAELAGPAGEGGRHPLPDPAVFGAAMRRAGVRADAPAVVYDGGQGWAAARAWWLLRWAGHDDVRVLDGGLAAWPGELSKETPDPVEGDFVPAPGALPLLDADGAAALARSGVLLDARAAERYRGDVEPIDRVGGHIPGALSAPTGENMAADGRFLSPEHLAARFAGLGVEGDAAEVGVYCGSGVSGAQQVLALELAGHRAALYAGSWSHWSADPSRPVATGPDPQ